MMQSELPYISLITPTFNSAEYVLETILSVKIQEYQNYEHIFIDGGSTDDTLDIIRRHAENCTVISEPDNGISDAFNKGIRCAKGDLIGIINSDDFYARNTLNRVAQAYLNSWNNVIFHGDMCILQEGRRRLVRPRPIPGLTFYVDLPVYHPTVFVPRSVYDLVGYFSTDFYYAMDFDFLLRAWKKGVSFQRVDGLIAYFRSGGAANTHALDCHREVLHSQLQNKLNPIVCYATYCAKWGVNRMKKLGQKVIR